MKKIIKKYIVTFIYYLFRIFPIKQNKIFVSNYYGKGYGDIPKYIINEFLKSKNNFDIVWVIKNDNSRKNLPSEIKYVKRNSIKCIYEQVTAKLWIDNCRKQFYERKRKKQFYLHTWHGGIPIKMIEKSVQNKLPVEYIANAKNDSKMINLMLSDNSYLTNLFKTVFWYDGDVFECCSPRNDIIINNENEIKNKVLKFFNIDDKINICLYAPTFRNDNSLECYNIDFKMLKSSLEKRFGGDWKILIRLHPNISNLSKKFVEYNDDIINASLYDDMQELIVSANFMISDYSSCILDYGLSYKNGCIYATDIENYSKDRGFYFNILKGPFPVVENNEDLRKLIENYDFNILKNNLKQFYKSIGIKDSGNGSKEIYKYLCKNVFDLELSDDYDKKRR